MAKFMLFMLSILNSTRHRCLDFAALQHGQVRRLIYSTGTSDAWNLIIVNFNLLSQPVAVPHPAF